MSNINPNDQVVGYYNLYKLDKEDKKDNILRIEVPSIADRDNISPSGATGLASLSASQNIPPQEAQVSAEVISPEVKPVLSQEMIDRAIIQLFDNGPDAAQRFKIKIRINLHDDKENPEFIGSLTTDWSNFKKYIPEECNSEIKELARKFRADIKSLYGVNPFIGKLHFNVGKKPGVIKSYSQIEPWTFVAVWWDKEDSVYRFQIMMYEWNLKSEFAREGITTKQASTGVIGQYIYINPQYDTRQRPATWAEMRAKRIIK